MKKTLNILAPIVIGAYALTYESTELLGPYAQTTVCLVFFGCVAWLCFGVKEAISCVS